MKFAGRFRKRAYRFIALVIIGSGLSFALTSPAGAQTLQQNGIGKDKTMIITSIQYTFDSKDIEKVASLFKELQVATAKEPGVVQFDIGRGTDDPNTFVLWEVYRDQKAFEAHRAAEYFQRLVLNGIRPLIQKRNVVNAAPFAMGKE